MCDMFIGSWCCALRSPSAVPSLADNPALTSYLDHSVGADQLLTRHLSATIWLLLKPP